MDDLAKLRMNLVAIQKVDPYAKEIVDSCPHVAFYRYVSNEWQKSEIEGSFFIYARVAEPFFSIFINNRLNTNSLVEPITNLELQSQPPFLLYRNQRSAISGFWFYCKEDCVRIHALLEKLIKKAGSGKTETTSVPQQQAQGQGVIHTLTNGNATAEKKPSDVDIFSMLSKAQAEFNGGGIEQQLSDMRIGQPSAPPQNQQQPPPQVAHVPLMKQISTTMPDITSPNVVSFFAAAQQPTNGVIPIIAENQHHGPPMIPKPFMTAAAVQPPVQTLDEIEKLHRVQSISPKVDPKLLNNLLNTSLQQQQHHVIQNHQSSSPQPMKLLQPAVPGSSSQTQPKLLAPTMFQASALEDKAIVAQQLPVAQPPRPEPLTHNQLIQAINYLLENDPEFIRKIHEAYIKSFNKIVSL